MNGFARPAHRGVDHVRRGDLAALLSAPTVAAAAKAAGLSERTARRRLAEADFRAAYQDARRQAVAAAVGRLQALLGKAAGTLERNMDSGVPAVEVRAAVAAFDLAFRSADLAEPGARGASGMFPYFDAEAALVTARAEAAAMDFSDLAREYKDRLRLRAMAEEMQRQMRAALAEQPAIESDAGVVADRHNRRRTQTGKYTMIPYLGYQTAERILGLGTELRTRGMPTSRRQCLRAHASMDSGGMHRAVVA